MAFHPVSEKPYKWDTSRITSWSCIAWITAFARWMLKQLKAVTVQLCQCKWPSRCLVSHKVVIQDEISKLIITFCFKDTHTQMAMTSAILTDRAVRAKQCSVLSSFFSGLILATCSNVTQQGPSESMTHYYRRSNRCVPSLILSKHTVSCHLWRKSTTALWTSCSPLSPSRYGTLNPGKLIYEAHLTVASKGKLRDREGVEGAFLLDQ